MNDRINGVAARRRGRKLFAGSSAALLFLAAAGAEANGLYRNGVGARAMAVGGADVGWAEDALGAMAANPAGLGFLRSTSLDLSLMGVYANGDYTNRLGEDGELSDTLRLVPDGAFATRLGPVTVGLAVIPESLLVADWDYTDTPGGVGGVSYGRQKHRSSILVLRSAVGVGVAVLPNLSLGGSLGLVYNENNLEAPYIFQTEPTLRGFKTLLDLETSGFGWNGSVGVMYRPHAAVQLGLSYTSETSITTDGHASGNVGPQLAALGVPFRPDFRYDAEVETTFPQVVRAGVAWKAHPRWRVLIGVDWIDWSGAFDDLPITLTNGNNADINGFVGSDRLEDTPSLDWRDRFVYRVGGEFAATETVFVRAGYSYGKSPVPDGTLTPLTAVIMEHTVGAGVGYRRGRIRVDVAYQYDLPVERQVGVSALQAGEYSGSRIEVDLHWLAVTTSIEF